MAANNGKTNKCEDDGEYSYKFVEKIQHKQSKSGLIIFGAYLRYYLKRELWIRQRVSI